MRGEAICDPRDPRDTRARTHDTRHIMHLLYEYICAFFIFAGELVAWLVCHLPLASPGLACLWDLKNPIYPLCLHYASRLYALCPATQDSRRGFYTNKIYNPRANQGRGGVSEHAANGK